MHNVYKAFSNSLCKIYIKFTYYMLTLNVRLEIEIIMAHFFGWGLRRTNIVKVIWRLSTFTGGGRLQVPLHAL